MFRDGAHGGPSGRARSPTHEAGARKWEIRISVLSVNSGARFQFWACRVWGRFFYLNGEKCRD
jgi:hypothetical protein